MRDEQEVRERLRWELGAFEAPPPRLEQVVKRAHRLRTRRVAMAVVVGALACIGIGVPLVLLSPIGGTPQGSQSPPGLRPGSIVLPPGMSLPEGRLVVGTAQGGQLVTGTTSYSVGGFHAFLDDLSVDGSKVLGLVEKREPTGVTRVTAIMEFDERTGRSLTIVRSGADETLGVARWAPDGTRIAYRLTVWGVDPSKVFPRTVKAQPVCVATPPGPTPQCFPEAGAVDDFAWSPDGTRLLLSAARQPLRILDLRTGQASVVVPATGSESLRHAGVRLAAFVEPRWSSSGDYVAITAPGAGPVVLSTGGRFVAKGVAGTEFQEDMDWSPKQDVLAYPVGKAPYRTIAIRLLEASTGQDTLLLAMKGRSLVTSLAWSPSGRWLALADVGNDQLVIVDTAGQSSPRIFPVDFGSLSDPLVAWAP